MPPMRYRLRTLMIALALGPPALALTWLKVTNPAYLWYLMLTTPVEVIWLLGVAALVALAVAATIVVDKIQSWLGRDQSNK